MGYIPLASSRTTLPMLLGTYECELNPAVETICGAGCDRIVDIGAAEGYYAVGMALRNPGVPLVCFEMNASVRYYLRRLARRNGVRPRIKILGECTPAALETALDGAERPAIICDCEGAEDLLLDPVRVPSLRRALILVETHEGMVDGVERPPSGAIRGDARHRGHPEPGPHPRRSARRLRSERRGSRRGHG